MKIALGLALISMVAAIASDWQVRKPAFYLCKPLTTVLVIALAVSVGPWQHAYTRWVALALAFCLGGDIALMGRGDRAFIAGLSSFLVGHVLFVIAFLHDLPRVVPGAHAWIGPLFGLVGLAVLMPRAGRLRLPIVAYVAVLVTMWLAADAHLTQRPGPSAQWALLGATVFIVSDSLLAWDRFVKPLPYAQPLILGTYFPAIMMMALSTAP